MDGHLALERWAVPHLYEFARRKVLHARASSCWSTISANGVVGGGGGGSATTDLQSVHQWTRILLLINPDLLTAWNLRYTQFVLMFHVFVYIFLSSFSDER